jgi:hypothetical protein
MEDSKSCAGASSWVESREIILESEEFSSANVVNVFARNNITFNNNNNNNNLLTASGLSPGGSGYFTFKLCQTY